MARNPLHDFVPIPLPEADFVVISEGFLGIGSCFRFEVQSNMPSSRGTFELLFTHVVEVHQQTRIPAEAWHNSWEEIGLDARRPNSPVERAPWALAYPGLAILENCETAKAWTDFLDKNMFSVRLETNRSTLQVTYHDVILRKLSDKTVLVDTVVFPGDAA